ncbi:hypothetical protein [Chryseobacterium flavum]|uniref:hypothetical protein n=2 Tax=Chryseobacterium flavum TaxID=415851 RepID=UPI0028A72ABF|nr:hypothetical protein [Chryseobacterium flavum]
MMKITLSFGMLLLSAMGYSQAKEYQLENVTTYRAKTDFYSNFLHIYSTADYRANLFVLATPMGNFSTLKLGEKMYAVYSEDGKTFQIDTEETLDRNKYRLNNEPDLDIRSLSVPVIKQTRKKEHPNSVACEVFTMKTGDLVDTLCIDTRSEVNTVPFLIPEAKGLKGLVYRIGNTMELVKTGRYTDVVKEELEKEPEQVQESGAPIQTSEKFVIWFDEKAEGEKYKAEYKKRKQP